MSPHPSSRWTARAAIGVLATACAVAVFACGDQRSSVNLGHGVLDGDGGPAFLPPVDGGEGGAPDAGVAMCVATECPYPFATCPLRGNSPPYRCGTNLSNDNANCGRCGRNCGQLEFGGNMACVDGECEYVCAIGAQDCNGIVDDGCEVDVWSDRNNCGACGVRCPPGVQCLSGQCGCPSATPECNGRCTDISQDPFNCGACGHVCKLPEDAGPLAPHTLLGCLAGQCKVACEQDWADCHSAIPDDGCETDVGGSDPTNCGACGNQCAPGKECFRLNPNDAVNCQCPAGQSICGKDYERQCFDLQSDPRNCGSCGFDCAEQICDRGRCRSACPSGFADCNGRSTDGCEADLRSDPRNCGACGTSCDNGVGQPCVDGHCAMRECDAGEEPTR